MALSESPALGQPIAQESRGAEKHAARTSKRGAQPTPQAAAVDLFAQFGAGLTGVDQGSSSLGDLDGDGNQDLVVTGRDSSDTLTAKVYLGDGSGGFSEAGADLVGVRRSSLSLGDLDEDGNLDLVITGEDANDDKVTKVYLGDGSGGFSEADAGLTDVQYGSISQGDLNGDGNLDLVITGFAENGPVANVYLGDGSEDFDDANANLTGVFQSSTSLGDLDGDGNLDIVLTGDKGSDQTTKVYLGDGTGGFTEADAGLTGIEKGSTSLGDLDGDGNLDLLVIGQDANANTKTTLYLGNGSGDFSKAGAGLTDVEEGSSSLGDLNGDGNLDIVLTGENANDDQTAKAYLGDGNGNFSEAGAGLTGVKVSSTSLGDVDNDGFLDLLITGSDPDFKKTTDLYENLSEGSLLAASDSETVSGDERVEFSGTGVAINFSGTSGSGTVTVQKFSDRPTVPLGIGEKNVSKYRFVVSASGGLTVGDNTEIRLDVSTLDGVGDASNVSIYTRSVRDFGVFEMLSTSFDSGANELVAQTGSFSEFALGAGSEPLPVELAGFEATLENEAARLTWQTASETDNAGFDVQQKVGPHASWSTLGFVESNAPGGTTAEAQTYRFMVEDLAVGTHQFRLKQRDLEGTTTVHDPVAVEVQMQEALRLGTPAPNPVKDRATVSFAVKDRAETTITLYNTLGQQVRTLYRGTPPAGEAQTARLETDGLSSGVYVLRLQAGGQTQTQRVTVVR